MKNHLLILSAFLLLAACQVKDKTGSSKAAPGCPSSTAKANILSGVVLETMDVPGYTYARLKTDQGETWAAAPQTKTAVGDTVVLTDPMLMKSYVSKSLNRTFDAITFAGSMIPIAGWRAAHDGKMGEKGKVCEMASGDAGKAEKGPHPKIQMPRTDVGKIEKAAGGVTLSEVFDDQEKFGGKTILVRGKVVKANYGILNKTWIHVQDGSGDDDLTVTTASTEPKTGNLVLVKGVFAKEKDLGMGYKFKGIVEDAQVTVEK